MEGLIGASDLVALPLQTMRDKLDIPTTLLESLAAGKPIVISDLSPMNELITGTDSHATPSQEVGLVVPPGDAKALADSAAALLSDPGLRKQMGQQGQVLVQTRFDVHRAANQYAELYREMVQ
jgi:glycosyltransferase involved in cell wall biosynthesis